MIRQADETMRSGIRDNWKKCFTLDDPRYTDYFFRYVFRPEYFYVDYENNRDVAASICRVPHAVMFNGRVLQMSMLSHACTMPDYRNEGRMKKIIETAVDACSHNELITLVGAVYGETYRPYGFEPIYYRTVYTLNRNEGARLSTYGVMYEPHPIDMLKVYSKFIRRFNGFYARNVDDFANLKREINARGGKVIACFNEKNQITGYATVLLEGKEAKIEECIYMDSVTIGKLVSAAMQERAVINLHVSKAENLSRLFPDAPYRDYPAVLARLNEPRLFSKLFNREVRTIQEAFQLSSRPLYLNERI
ncbi:MAG: GNAT family N-acetyltransferase [Solobacterium sp.]|nr:GNAT family N-acetyltransferase [Solobacterium sp.]